MRIDFAARYKEVQGLLQASTKPIKAQNDEAFEADLGSLLLQPAETTELPASKVETYTPKQVLQEPLDELRASLRLEEPMLQMPAMTPATPAEVVPVPAEAAPQSVKTPTVLEVKRVPLPAVNAQVIPQLDKQEIRDRLIATSKKIGVDPILAQAVVSAESSFNAKAVSNDGHASKGLFQLLDSTGKHLMSKTETEDKDYDPFNPDLNITLGTSYLKYLHDIFKTPTELPNQLQTRAAADNNSLERLAVAAFNAGEGRVASAQSRSERSGKDPAYYDHVAPFLPRSTREYVSKVVEGKKQF